MTIARRQVLKLLSLLPWTGSLALAKQSPLEDQLGNDYILVNGWILKKSDVTDFIK